MLYDPKWEEKTRNRPDIPVEHYAALLSVKDDLLNTDVKFRMYRWDHCICGLMRNHLGKHDFLSQDDPRYRKLFLPSSPLRMFFATRKQAVRAIDRFLANNKSPWGRH